MRQNTLLRSKSVLSGQNPEVSSLSNSADGVKIDSAVFGDCNELLKKVRSKSVDLIATDPPYEINFENNAWDKEKSLDWDFLGKEFHRILKPTGNLIVFQSWSCVMDTHSFLSKYFTLKNWIIYDRVKGRGAKTNLVSTREDILWYVKDAKNYTYHKIPSTILKKTGGTIGNKNGNKYRALSNVWTDIPPIVPWSKERVQHPTQKPLFLMERIIDIFSNAGDLVLDPYAGSGTTAVVSIKNDRKYIVFENNQEYFDIIKNRIDCTYSITYDDLMEKAKAKSGS